MSVDKERVEWIDIVKGIGIICIVIGHIFMPNTFIHKSMLLFNLPLFFFMSGFLYKKGQNSRSFITKKAKSLLIPYVAIFLLLYPFVTVFLFSADLSFDQFKTDALYYLMSGIELRNRMDHVFVAMWFITCLFLVQVLYHFMHKLLSEKQVHIVTLIMLIAGYYVSTNYKYFFMYWSAQNILAALPLYHIGYTIKQNMNVLNKYTIVYYLAGTLSLLSLFVLPKNMYDILVNNYGIPVLTLTCCTIVIVMIIYISKFIMDYKILSIPLQHIGQASLTIMAFHLPLYAFLWKYFQLSSAIAIPLMIIVPFLLHQVLNLFRITKFLFLGKTFRKKAIIN